MWRVLKSLPCDIFLGAHGNYFGLEEKYPRMKEGAANPFIDPEGYKSTSRKKRKLFTKSWRSKRPPLLRNDAGF